MDFIRRKKPTGLFLTVSSHALIADALAQTFGGSHRLFLRRQFSFFNVRQIVGGETATLKRACKQTRQFSERQIVLSGGFDAQKLLHLGSDLRFDSSAALPCLQLLTAALKAQKFDDKKVRNAEPGGDSALSDAVCAVCRNNLLT